MTFGKQPNIFLISATTGFGGDPIAIKLGVALMGSSTVGSAGEMNFAVHIPTKEKARIGYPPGSLNARFFSGLSLLPWSLDFPPDLNRLKCG